MKLLAKTYFSDIYELFYPKICGACNGMLLKGEMHLCFTCLNNLPFTKFENIKENPAQKLFEGRIPIEFATSYLYFSKSELTQNILHNIKYRYRKQLATFVGQQLGASILQKHQEHQFDSIIPVPLHPKKTALRGYNQSELIAEGISVVLNVPINTKTIRRIKNTETQTQKNKTERWENIKDAFELIDEKAIYNKHILLVDDVLTSGATLEACASKLKINDNIKMSIATLAIAF